MGKTLGIDRDLARKIKRMSRKELDGYLTRVTDKSYNNGYEQGLAEGIALTGQGLAAVLKEEKSPNPSKAKRLALHNLRNYAAIRHEQDIKKANEDFENRIKMAEIFYVK